MQQLSNRSRFGWIVDGASEARPAFDIPVHETKHFVALPSVGSLTPGWLLVVPRRKMANLSWLAPGEVAELQEITAELRERLSIFRGEVFEFEHGGVYGGALSCGVEQAHLHLVPLPFDLLDCALKHEEIAWQRNAPFPADSMTSPHEYLWARAPDQRAIKSIVERPVSQWFRRLIASELNKSTEWDYKSAPNLPVLEHTLSALEQAAGVRR